MSPQPLLRSAGRTFVPHARPCLGPDEEAAALRVLRSRLLAPGAEAARLEGLVARLAGAPAAVALNSGTMALTLALRALGVGVGDAVALPSFTCAAVLHAVRAAGARPLVCDIDAATLALDPGDLKRRANGRLRAVVVVHPFGNPSPVDPLRVGGAFMIEDCAQSPGARLLGAPVGAAGDAAVFSFGPTKLLTCGGPGGVLASPSARIVHTARDLAGHDEKEDDGARVNGLMGDLHAAVAGAQIGRLRELVARRRAIAERFDNALVATPSSRPALPAGGQPVFYRYLLAVGDAGGTLDRLQARGVMARRPVFKPLHRLLAGGDPCPRADAAWERWISLPLFPAMSDAEVDQVIEEVLRCRS